MSNYSKSLKLIALSFYSVLVNPLGWHMFLHASPFYLPGIVKYIRKMRINSSFMSQYYFFFLLYALFSSFAIASYSGTGGKLLRYGYEFVIMMFIAVYPFNVQKISYLFRAYVYSCFAICIKMLLQRATLETDENRFSILNFGKLMDPNFLAALFVFPTLMLINNIIIGNYKKKTILLLLLFLVVIVATGSRGALFAIGIGAIVIYLRQHIHFMKKVLLLIGMGIVGFLFLYLEADKMSRFSAENLNDGSNELRFNLWAAAWDIFKSSPIFGSGANSMIALGLKHGARINLMVHNTFLEILADYGILGFIFWIATPFTLLKRAISRGNVLVQGGIIATLFCAFFISAQNSAFYWQNIMFCYVMLKLKITNIQIFKYK